LWLVAELTGFLTVFGMALAASFTDRPVTTLRELNRTDIHLEIIIGTDKVNLPG